jgi:enamine deaminase RidA (YjgF/YER057c/UK114 family)
VTKRRSIEIAGLSHGAQPIPAASRVGPLVMTGGVYGLDRDTGTIPDDPAEQVRLMFENLALIMQAAGGDLGSVARMTLFVKTPEVRPIVNDVWIAAFPDAASRPARHTQAKSDLPANMLVQCDATAWVAA